MSLQIFVSSMCYELRDCRASIRDYLKELGAEPMLSNEKGFPQYGGMEPYASCLKVLEECPMVIGVIDREYGKNFDNWNPYHQYKNISPTHAEILHALAEKKNLMIFIHRDTMAFYEIWRKNGHSLLNLPKGLSLDTLEMIREIKNYSPAPWIRTFTDVSEIIFELKMHFIDEVKKGLMEQSEKDEYLKNKLLEVEEKLANVDKNSKKIIDNLKLQKEKLEIDIKQKENDINVSKKIIFLATTRDEVWFHHIRTRLMDKQPGRVPFHNAAEVSMRGYHCSSMRDKKPILKNVTWKELPYTENNLHRGYYAGLIFEGNDFAPGITIGRKNKGETLPSVSFQDYQWTQPNIYFGDYLELAAHNDPIEGPLSWYGMEYCLKNPNGKTSEWVEFSYPFDFPALKKVMDNSYEIGKKLFQEGKYEEAIEPLRKAMVFSDKINGNSDSLTKEARQLWDESLDLRTLVKLRFKVGAKIKVISGEHIGVHGFIEELKLRSPHLPYQIKVDGSEDRIFVAEGDVEELLRNEKEI